MTGLSAVIDETGQIMTSLLAAPPAPGSAMDYMASASADMVDDEFAGTPDLGLIIVKAIAAANAIWHAIHPDQEHADPLQVIALLGCTAAELHRRELAWAAALSDSPAAEPGPTRTTQGVGMTFSIAAVGTKEEVAAQLEAAQITLGDHRFNELGADLRDLLVRHFKAETASAGAGHEYRYTVKANGHGGGGSALYVDLDVQAHWITVPDAAATAEDDQDTAD
jgi:hypothetical protein